MILRSLPDGRQLYITQTDHAALAAEMLSLWRADDLPRRRELLFAVREHDNGWREVDSAPRRRSDGRPHDFDDLPEVERRELWDRGVRRWLDAEPWSSRLILRHALTLHAGRESRPWLETLESWRVLDGELADLSETNGATELETAYRWLSLADELSLGLCRGRTDAVRRDNRTFRFESDQIAITPFPFAGATSFKLRAREIPDRTWPDERSLAVALASSRWHTRTVRVVPGPLSKELGE